MATLRDLRKRNGLTQAELSSRTGLRQATISALENGRTKAHSGTLLALAIALDTGEKEIRLALRESRGESDDSQLDAIEQMARDWPFLDGLDADLRSGLASSLVAEWTHSSTALEGNTISVGDTLFVLTEGLTVSGKSLREHQELHGHAQALGATMAWTRARKPIQIEQLHQLHRAVQTGVAIDSLAPVGGWKVEPNGTTVITSKGTTQWHDYSRPQGVPALVEAWLKSLAQVCRNLLVKPRRKADDAPLQELAIDAYTDVHLGLVGIHPYADGNGRMARLLANIPVMRAGFPPILVSLAKRREYLVLLGDYTLARGQLQPREELVLAGPKRDALRSFFAKQWRSTLKLIAKFHRQQRRR